MTALTFAVVVWVFAVGVWGVARSRNLIRLAVCLTVAQSSTYILLVAVGYRRGGTAPIFAAVPVSSRAVDPVVQAMAFVDVVVEAVVAALLLALAIQAARRHGTVDPDEIASRAP